MPEVGKKFKLIWPAQLALIYNVTILLSVTLDLSWVRTRAAGGQYSSFPLSLRVLYLFMAVGTGILIFYLRKLISSTASNQDFKFARYLGWLFVVSTIMQLISRSRDEQWNAIPASIIALTFLLIYKRNNPKIFQ
ncbi:MAG: hypothetical protein ACKN9L_06510 [Actinomycetota bacterium]